jgi:hypothetical protein
MMSLTFEAMEARSRSIKMGRSLSNTRFKVELLHVNGNMTIRPV